MNFTKIRDSKLFLVGIPLILMLSVILFSLTKIFELHSSHLANAAILDLVLTIPLIYFLLIRKSKIDNKTVIRFFILGLVIATFIIPKENQFLLEKIKIWVLPIIELIVLTYVIFGIKKAVKTYNNTKKTSFDILTVVRTTCFSLFPKAFANFLAIEFTAFYYGFLHWKKIELKKNEFTYHKSTGTQATLSALIFLILIETSILHILIVKWNPTMAWVMTIISIYSGFQIFGFLKSLRKRPTVILKDTLKLRYGILCEVAIDIQDIESIENTFKEIEQNEHLKYLSPLGNMEGHNLIIHLKREHILTGLYGIEKKFNSIAVHIDEKSEFKHYIESLLKH
jgi:hypothetical protein